jgi:5-methylcytosine-specific restriction endonuclease McrA
MADPYPKSRQLARGERRYRRKVASRKQWQAIIDEKGSRCRLQLCGGVLSPIEYHHVVSRSHGGDDVADNIVPLCAICHGMVTRRVFPEASLADRLYEPERAYVVSKLGEHAMERLFGV